MEAQLDCLIVQVFNIKIYGKAWEKWIRQYLLQNAADRTLGQVVSGVLNYPGVLLCYMVQWCGVYQAQADTSLRSFRELDGTYLIQGRKDYI